GRVIAFERGETRVEHDGVSAPLVARIAASLDDATLAAAARDQREVLLLFEDGDPSRPIVVALLRSQTPVVDALLTDPLPSIDKVARIDGKRVLIEGKEEVVLQCGNASLTLRRDGKAVLRGVNIVSQAEQVHKVRGGKVQIN